MLALWQLYKVILTLSLTLRLDLSKCLLSGGTKPWLCSLPESEALPSVGLFAECFLSGTRQRRLCREPHSVKLGSRQRASLPSAGHSTQDPTRQRHVCKGGARQRAVSGRPKADGRQSLPRAKGWHSAKSLLCRVPTSGHSAKDPLPSVFSRHSTKYISIFLILSPKLFVVCSYTM
jgi:hypothetical protein